MSAREKAIGQLLALVVHDLRNPAAAISANIAYVKESEPPDDPDVREAIDDLEAASTEIMRGLEQLAWIGRWLAEEPLFDAPPAGELRASLETALRRLSVPADLPPEAVVVRGGGAGLTRLVELLLGNSHLHAPGTARVRARLVGEAVELDVIDGGRAIAPELRDVAFSVEGQHALKGRGDGRYSRVAGLLAARLLAEALGARLTAEGQDGQAIFRIVLDRM